MEVAKMLSESLSVKNTYRIKTISMLLMVTEIISKCLPSSHPILKKSVNQKKSKKSWGLLLLLVMSMCSFSYAAETQRIYSSFVSKYSCTYCGIYSSNIPGADTPSAACAQYNLGISDHNPRYEAPYCAADGYNIYWPFEEITSKYMHLVNVSAYCPEGYVYTPGAAGSSPQACYKDIALPPPAPKGQGGGCDKVGNPCSITTGNKFQVEGDWNAAVGPLSFTRTYNSLRAKDSNAFPLGKGWTHNYNQRLQVGRIVDTFWNVAPAALTDPTTVVVLDRADGKRVVAIQSAGAWLIDADLSLRLSQVGNEWQVHDVKSNVWEHYNSDGRLIRVDSLNGHFVVMQYENDQLSQVTDQFGRTIGLAYNSLGLLAAVTLPDGNIINYGYDDIGRLASITWPNNKIKQYVYSEASAAPSGNPFLLTGIVDENNQRYASYGYNAQDRAIRTEHAGGAGLFLLNGLTVTDPLGVVRIYTASTFSGTSRITSKSRQGLVCCDAEMIYDANGNITQSKRFGVTTTHTYDSSRNLETSRTEAAGTALARIITTEWHPTFALPVSVTEPGRVTTYTYDSNGNRLTQTITGSGTSRTWTWTYNTYGQALSLDGPRTDIADTTTYEYDSSGNLVKTTDAIGEVTEYSAYNANGQPGQIRYANSRVLNLSYDERGRLTEQRETVSNPDLSSASSGNDSLWPQWLVDFINYWCDLLGAKSPFKGNTVPNGGAFPALSLAGGEAITSYVYDAVGQLKEVHLPDGEILSYDYDAAHRLIGQHDALGNTITYTLDAMGNRTETLVHDSSGALQQKSTQVFNALSQLQQVLGNNGQSITNSYDDEGHLIDVADAQNRHNGTTYDALDRQATQTDAANGQTRYTYNALDQLLTVTDARNNATIYTPNAFGEVEQEQSPDTGTQTRTYSQGLLTRQTDARGITTAYQYDAAGRVTQRTANGTVISYAYDSGDFGQGRLTRITDPSGVTDYTYNSQGRVLEKLIGFKDGLPLRVRYAYTLGGKLQQTATPGRHLIEYNYDSSGRLSGIQVDGNTFLDNIHYGTPGIIGWEWATAGQRLETHDLDGRMIALSSGSALSRTYRYNSVNQLTGTSDSSAGVSDNFGYDDLDRLTLQQASAGNSSYSYDAVGNRQSKTLGTATTTYTIAATSNRLMQEQDSSLRSYHYLPTGQITDDGQKTYGYDDFGRLTSINGPTSQTNVYNGLGQRVKKIGAQPGAGSPSGKSNKNAKPRKDLKKNNTQTLYFAYDEAGQLLGEYEFNGTPVREYIWLGNHLVGMISSQTPNTVLAVHTDHLGTARAVSNGSSVLWRWEGDAFGNSPANEDADGDGNTLTQPLRFPGQYHDQASGLNYNYYRDYDPSTGRYVESDPIGLNGGLNTYAYVGGNPVSFVDPDGTTAVAGAEIGAEFGGAVGGPPGAVIGGLIGAGAGAALGGAAAAKLKGEQCPDCEPIIRKINDIMGKLRTKYAQQLRDQHGLYSNHHDECDAHPDHGSWVGHERRLKALQEGLRRQVMIAQSLGCPVPSEAYFWLGVSMPRFPVC